MNWISIEETPPEEGQFVLSFRTTYPSHYWVGYWISDHFNSDAPDEYWIPLPDVPTNYGTCPKCKFPLQEYEGSLFCNKCKEP